MFQSAGLSVTISQLLETTEGAASYDLIQQLATESNRYTGRKGSTLRDLVSEMSATLDDGSVPDREVRFGVELLVLDSWASEWEWSEPPHLAYHVTCVSVN